MEEEKEGISRGRESSKKEVEGKRKEKGERREGREGIEGRKEE